MDSYRERHSGSRYTQLPGISRPIFHVFGAYKFSEANGETSTSPMRNNKVINPVPKQTHKGSCIEPQKSDLAEGPPQCDTASLTEDNDGILDKVADNSDIYLGGISVPNDELTLHSDQHPDPHPRGTGSSTVGLGKIHELSVDAVNLAKGNDIGESWRKNFPPPLAGAGTKSKDDVGHEVDNIEANGNLDMGNGDTGDSDDEYYKQVEQRRASRTSAGSSSPEPVYGNHQLPYQMENIGSVEGQEASSSGHNGGSGAGSGSDEHDEDRRRVGDLESGTRRRVRNSSNMTLVATFITIAVQSTSAIFALSVRELSPLAQKLFTGVLVTNLVGFLCLYVILFPSRCMSPRADEILSRVGGAAAAIGFLLMMGIKLSLRIIIPACVVVLAASVLSFMP